MSAASVKLAEQRAEAAKVAVEAAEVRLEAAKKAVKLAGMAAEHAKQSLELERLRLEHADCCPEQEPPASSPDRKRARAADPVAAAQQELSAARRELLGLQEGVLRQREEQRQTAGRLVAVRRRHRDCTASQLNAVEEAEWLERTLVCSSKTLVNKVARKKFVAELCKAPCLGTLQLHLRNYEGCDYGQARPLPQSVLQALAAAPSRIKRLWCQEVGWDGCEAVFALLERAKDHLDEFEVSDSAFRSLRDEAVRRLWGILVGSNVSELRVAPELMRDVGYVFKAGDWPRLQRVSFEGYVCFSRAAPGELAMMAPLLRAHAASLRVVSLPWKIGRELREAAFQALATCSALEELTAPCYQELGLLSPCPKLTKLKVHRMNMTDFGADVSGDILAVGRFLCAPATVSQLESLTLSYFQLDLDKVLPVYKAVRGLKQLKSLTVETCFGFDKVLGATLKALPCLEELHLLRCDWLHAKVVTEHVTLKNAPKLKLLELDTEVVDEEDAVSQWKEDMRKVRFAFRRANPDFRLEDCIDERYSSSSDGGRDCNCAAKDADSDCTPPKCTCVSSDNDTP